VKRIDEPADDRFWDEVLDINLNGVQFLTRGLVKHIPDRGRIVNISSQLGQEARAGYGAYCASKFALIGLTKVWAKELGPRGITVNAVCPGWVKTDQAVGDMERLAREKGVPVEKLYKEICEPLELRRFTEPEEVAQLVGFLVSPEGSGVTGRDWLMNTVWNQT
jgi:NAD(P)-dependent dehydrogenase (short-subunit alcohol dehydrogenase family)